MDGGVTGLVQHLPLRVVEPVHMRPPQQHLQLGHVALLAGVLVSTLATSSFSLEVRQLRRVASLALLSSMMHNKVLVKENLKEVKVVVE